MYFSNLIKYAARCELRLRREMSIAVEAQIRAPLSASNFLCWEFLSHEYFARHSQNQLETTKATVECARR